MTNILHLLIIIVALLHIYFLILEMFLWQKPLGLKTFKNSPSKAADTAVLAANQGLYNGFLAAGLIISFFLREPATALAFQFFFLGCVSIAGIYGAYTVSKRIFWIQAAPALIAIIILMTKFF